MKTYIIAEAGVNHNGQMDLAYKLIDKAVEAGADCIKFQTFKSQNLVSKFAEKAAYQRNKLNDDESQLDMIKKLELRFDDFIDLKKYANKKGIEFCSTPFDMESISFLHDLKMPFWKIPSGEITNLPYLEKIAKFDEPIIMSTGMCNINEVTQAIEVLRKYSTKKIIVLHCNTEYPTPYKDVNLMAMKDLQMNTNCEVGYSDHTLGIEIPIAAVTLGAKVIEKHFTLDKTLEGPDHMSSLDPDELKAMVEGIRHVEIAIGDGYKRISQSEMKNIHVARKSIVASKSIKKGETFDINNLTCKRPGNGISPMKWYEIIGQKAIRDFNEDELIEI